MPYKDPKDPRLIACRKKWYQAHKKEQGIRTKKGMQKWMASQMGQEYKIRYRSIARELEKKSIASLSETYIKKQLKKEGYTDGQMKQYPELIEIKRIIIKTKRLCKTSSS
jgi:hypothetical protein